MCSRSKLTEQELFNLDAGLNEYEDGSFDDINVEKFYKPVLRTFIGIWNKIIRKDEEEWPNVLPPPHILANKAILAPD